MEGSDNGRTDSNVVHDEEVDHGMADRSEERENEARPRKENHNGKEREESTKKGPRTDGEGKRNAKRRRRRGEKRDDPKMVRNDGKL